MNESEGAYNLDNEDYDADEPADFTEALFDRRNGKASHGTACILCTHSNGALNGGGMMNTILGAVGGLGAGSILGAVGMDATGGAEAAAAVSNFDISTLIGAVAGGGAALGGIGGVIKNMMSKG